MEIRNNLQSAEAAVARVAIEFHNTLKESDVSMIRDKAADVLDVGQRLVRCLDETAIAEAPTADVIVASSVVPSQLVRYVHQGVIAVIVGELRFASRIRRFLLEGSVSPW